MRRALILLVQVGVQNLVGKRRGKRPFEFSCLRSADIQQRPIQVLRKSLHNKLKSSKGGRTPLKPLSL